ncbi:LemA protein [Thermotomaculum hydrothermale]|uniref:LemA protein n=1 Tax=Thermotomaculum hydrothermale TaxID=981385 RepID=A0A7R6PGU4_9BACT|nr:LemA family protein [Thermotomaculum hydrothermale]BBB32349.1 LemA protein [Thermotomaculum hydrothermale]
MGGLIFLGVFIFLVFIIVAYFVGVYNRLVSLKNQVPQAFANIDVLLKQRHDEIPKLVETVKGYAKHERETLENVIKARNMYTNANTIDEKLEANNMITAALRQLFALSERYPELKANENFLNLQRRITDIENALADRREMYNFSATAFNTAIEQIPEVFIARMLNYKPFPLFEANEEDRQDVKISFN